MARPSPNILFVVLDTVRAKSLSLYGPEEDPGTNLDQLGTGGRTYTRAVAPSAWTVPSHASMFTGRLPSEHNVTSPDARLDPAESLPRRLADVGYTTFGASANPFIGPRNGFADAFEEFHHVVPTPTTHLFEGGCDALAVARGVDETGLQKLPAIASRVARGPAPLRTGGNLLWYKLSQHRSRLERERQSLSGGPKITDAISTFIRRKNLPFFAFANYMEAHGPYCAPDEYVDRFYPDDAELEPEEIELDPWQHMLGVDKHSDAEIEASRGLYRAAIAYLDDQVASLLETLESAGIREETIVVVTSDHGEAFGERGRLDHNCLYQPVTRVPLVVDHPERAPAEVSTPVSLRSLYSTLLDAADIESDAGPTLSDTSDDDPVLSQYFGLHVKNLKRRFDPEQLRPFTERFQSAFTPEFQLLVGDRDTEELLPMDGSVQPVAGNEATRERLRSMLPPFPDSESQDTSSAGGPDEELLRSLGYIE